MSVFSCREKDIEIDNYLPMLHSGAMSQVSQACMEKKLQSSKTLDACPVSWLDDKTLIYIGFLVL